MPFLEDFGQAKDGFSLHFKLMLDNDIDDYQQPRYLFTIAAKHDQMHCYILKGHVCCGVTYSGKEYKVETFYSNFSKRFCSNFDSNESKNLN